MATFEISDTVGEIVRDRPSLSRLFEQAKVDYCCGGKKTLDEACRKQGIDPLTFLAQLDAIANSSQDPEIIVANLSLTELADHIEYNHHAYLHSELPRLEKIVAKVAAVHGEKESRLHQIKDIFLAVSQELETHLQKEEKILFPMIRQLESSTTVSSFHCGTIANPVHQMESEHDEAGVALGQLRQLTDNYTAPLNKKLDVFSLG
jgi:regulator of cell morphogenesis and NO signaling